MTIEDATIECPICKTIIEDIYLFPDVIARFYKWTKTVGNINEWYCPKHSIDNITDFEDKPLK